MVILLGRPTVSVGILFHDQTSVVDIPGAFALPSPPITSPPPLSPACVQPWPADALQAVATQFLAEVDMSEEERAGCIQLCQFFHTSTESLSRRFLELTRRHNYVTPTSYLELIATYKALLDKRRK